MTLNHWLLFFFCILIPAIWVSSLYFDGPVVGTASRTAEQLRNTDRVMQAYLEKYNDVPRTFSELRAFARARQMPFSSFDGYGQRMQYFRLDKENYLLRSFGRDGKQNTIFSDKNAGLMGAKSGKFRPTGLVHEYGNVERIGFYPAAILLGSVSPNKVWWARLFADHENGTKHLIVRHRDRKDFFMLGRHDGVEEFLWLPDGYRLVFSASGSSKYQDGIYLWNLLDDTVTNVLDESELKTHFTEFSKQGTLFLSLAGIDVVGPKLFAYIGSRSVASLDLAVFFSEACLFSIDLPIGGEKAKMTRASELTSRFVSPLARPWRTDSFIANASEGTRSQREWLQLPLEGELEDVLATWQRTSEKLADTPLFPYGLWYLSLMYANAYQIVKNQKAAKRRQDSEILRSYAAELTDAVIKLPLAPTYLKALSSYSFGRLTTDEQVPTKFSKFSEKNR